MTRANATRSRRKPPGPRNKQRAREKRAGDRPKDTSDTRGNTRPRHAPTRIRIHGESSVENPSLLSCAANLSLSTRSTGCSLQGTPAVRYGPTLEEQRLRPPGKPRTGPRGRCSLGIRWRRRRRDPGGGLDEALRVRRQLLRVRRRVMLVGHGLSPHLEEACPAGGAGGNEWAGGYERERISERASERARERAMERRHRDSNCSSAGINGPGIT